MSRQARFVVAVGALAAGCAMSPASRPPPRSGASARYSRTPTAQTISAESTSVAESSTAAPAREPADRPSVSFEVDSDAPPPPTAPAATVMGATGAATSAQPGPAPTTPGRARDDVDIVVREARIGAQVQRIREEQIRLATSPGVCRDVCYASGSICLAAQELCRLTGDADPRCTRARSACVDAGHQRDGACPVCPPTR